MNVLFLFLDGVGLGVDDARFNPFARAPMPNLQALLGGGKLLASTAPFEGRHATLLALDATLGVEGLPQSATGQAVLLTGLNIPKMLGYHYGPKPNPAIAHYLNGNTLFRRVKQTGQSAALLNAYPPRYFQAIASGRRSYSSIPLAVVRAALPLFTQEDLYAGRALSADFTAAAWRTLLGFPDAPRMSPQAAGRKLAELAQGHAFAMFEYWASDYAGHKQDMQWALEQLTTLDEVLGGLLEDWDEARGLILITSDHGNLEDLSTRRHTPASVPALLIGDARARAAFASGLNDLTEIHEKIIETILGQPSAEPGRALAST